MFCRDLRKVSMVTVGSLLTMYSSKVLLDSGKVEFAWTILKVAGASALHITIN